MKRVFVAVPVADEARHRLSHLIAGTVDSVPGRVVRPENWHVTLRFLGEIDETSLERLSGCLDGADLGRSFDLRWSGMGAFPRSARATVLWLGLDRGRDELVTLAGVVDHAVDRAGFGQEDRPFRPHLTLSRLRPSQDVTRLIESAGRIEVPMPVDEVVVYQTLLGEGAASYRVLEVFPLVD